MKTLVTGASGHIGANLVRALLEKGRTVRVLTHKDQRALEGLNIETVSGNICDLESVSKACRGVKVVYHLAGCISLSMNDWPLLESVNVLGTRNVVTACLKQKVKRLVHFSSIHSLAQGAVYARIDETCNLVEADDASPYSRSKAEGEREILKG
ncbi:MAG: NAD-dependent epimerase/dehydratase family protein, partial [Dehalococcoidales bacterium]|nr:NAD-dependent epimerase/dehydratase family protein [Dehalococcoidales bacterium]